MQEVYVGLLPPALLITAVGQMCDCLLLGDTVSWMSQCIEIRNTDFNNPPWRHSACCTLMQCVDSGEKGASMFDKQDYKRKQLIYSRNVKVLAFCLALESVCWASHFFPLWQPMIVCVKFYSKIWKASEAERVHWHDNSYRNDILGP